MKDVLHRDNRFYRTASESVTLIAGEWVYDDDRKVGPTTMIRLLERAVGESWWTRSKREGLEPLVPQVRGRRSLMQAAAAFYGFVWQVTLQGTDASTERERLRRAQAARGLAKALAAVR